ncbi:MAG: hypothetical protein KDD29_06095 [Flavobacteriales bacterium]|nr:hypothetical protein [Flavobacteriales bacterium]MCB9336232.1 hypothetical protein [Flavobacteriales bacterium]
MSDNKLFSIILIALLGLSALLSVLFFANVVSEGLLITWCYILLGIAAVTAIVFPIITMAKNLKAAKSALIGVVALVVVFALGYVMAGSEEFYTLDGNLLADEATSKKSEAGLIAFYIMGAAAIGAVIYAEVSKMLK